MGCFGRHLHKLWSPVFLIVNLVHSQLCYFDASDQSGLRKIVCYLCFHGTPICARLFFSELSEQLSPSHYIYYKQRSGLRVFSRDGIQDKSRHRRVLVMFLAPRFLLEDVYSSSISNEVLCHYITCPLSILLKGSLCVKC